MKKALLTTAIIAAFAGVVYLMGRPAHAGNLYYSAPAEPPVIIAEQPGSMGGSGAWLIPLLAIGLVALAVSQGDDPPDDDTPDPCKGNPDCYEPEPCEVQ
jgi:hypothetical protein